jgi:hypothetical protein
MYSRLLNIVLFVAWLAGCDTPSASRAPEAAGAKQNMNLDGGVGFESSFSTPPRSSRPWVRWWWPGGSVQDDVLASELDRIDALGFGGVEVQPFRLGLSEADIASDPAISSVGTPTQLAHVRAAALGARERQLAFSLTLGSGWPSGGVFSRDVRPRELLYARVDATGPSGISQPLPVAKEPAWVAQNNAVVPACVGPFDPALELVAVVAAPVLDATLSPPVLGPAIDVSSAVVGGILTWQVPAGLHTIMAVYRHAVAQHVTGSAFAGDPAAAFTIDHLDPGAASTWLAEQAGPYLDALAPAVPDEVFIDSPELMGELPWSSALAGRFGTLTGYDYKPFFPALFRQGGEAKYSDVQRSSEAAAAFSTEAPLDGIRAREDYEDVRAEVFASAYVGQVLDFAQRRGTKLRFQAHGGWGVYLDDYAMADVPESEGLYAGGSTDFLALAGSAAHVSGRATASAEAFVTLSLSGAPLDQDDMWRLAGRAFGAGIGRLVYHGLPYPKSLAASDHWSPFGSGLQFTQDFSDHNITAWLLPFNAAITRLSWALAQGRDRADVAWLFPDRQVADRLAVSSGHVVPGEYETPASIALRSTGLVYDRISPHMLARSSASAGRLTVGSAAYGALFLSDWQTADPEAVDAAVAAARAGVPVVVMGALPTRARGRKDMSTRDGQVAASVETLRSLVHVAATPEAIAGAFATAGVRPLVSPQSAECPVITLRHRETDQDHVFFVFNEQQTQCAVSLSFALPVHTVRALDPETGTATDLAVADNRVSLLLPASRARVLVVR